MIAQDRISNRINDLINQGVGVLQTQVHTDGGQAFTDTSMFQHWHASSLSALEQIFPAKHSHPRLFNERVTGRQVHDVESGIGILRAAKADIDGGWLTAVTTLVAAEVFTDFLDMADHLLSTNYFQPAASLIGAVLEDSMRRLAINHNIPLDAKETLNTLDVKLRKGNVYNMLESRQIDVWREVRNNADHAKWGEFTKKDVTEMLAGVRGFLAKHLG
jgi:hypothetical protein